MTIQEVIETVIPLSNSSPHSKCWSTKELSDLQKRRNIISCQLYHLHNIQEHPIHQEYKDAANRFKEVIDSTRLEHWIDWLEEITAKDVYIANKYLTGGTSDYSKACIPSLKTTLNSVETSLNTNK